MCYNSVRTYNLYSAIEVWNVLLLLRTNVLLLLRSSTSQCSTILKFGGS